MSETEQTTAVQEQVPKEVPVTRIRVDGNSVLPLLRAFASKGYTHNIYSLSEAAKLHEVFQFLDNLSSQSSSESQDAVNASADDASAVNASVDEATKDMADTAAEVAEVTSAVDAVANAVEEAVNKKLSSE